MSPACKIARFCSEACYNLTLSMHRPYCLPSVSLRESKSLAVKPRSPDPIREEALSRIPIPPSPENATQAPNITANYTFYLDPRNFTTFRMKLNATANTTILFSRDADIQYTTLTDAAISADPETAIRTPTVSATSLHIPPKRFQWMRPAKQDSITHIPAREEDAETTSTYLIVAPGQRMLASLAERRIKVRQGGGEGARFRDLEVPNPGLIEYAQGLLLTGYPGMVFMYVVEWEEVGC